MIQFEKVSKSFGGQTLFEDASFQLQKGEKCSLLGRNGSGKSTLLRLLAGQDHPDKGDIRYPKGYRLGWLKQHLHFTAPTLVEEVMGSSGEKQYLAEKFLMGLGFSKEDFAKSPTSFSGGYQLRIHLCQVLLSDPDGLLLDEPTNYLDLPSIRWMRDFLSDWKGELILISHDRHFVDSVCSSCIGIHRNKVRKLVGSTEEFYQTIIQEEEIHERTRVSIEKKKEKLEGFVERFGAKATKAKQAQSRVKALEKMDFLEKLVTLKSLSFHFPYHEIQAKKLIEASGLFFSYEGSKSALIADFNLEIERRQRIAIIGKNGAGKSTLLKLLSGELSCSQGKIIRNEAVQVGYFGQTHILQLNPQLTIEEEIQSAGSDLTIAQVRSICGKMLFEGDAAQKKVEVLSGGEKSRVLLGKLLARPTNLLLLDEPSHHLDMESVEALTQALSDYPGTIVLVTHSEQLLHALSTDKLIICKEKGQELFLGTYADFLEKQGWEEEKKEVFQKKVEEKPRMSQQSLLKKEIQKLEKKWLLLEQEKEEIQNQLLMLSTAYDKESKEKAQVLAEHLERKKEESENLFAQWSELLDQSEISE